MAYVIVAVGFANGRHCPHAGQYLEWFDFEADNGVGFGAFTTDINSAKRFPGLLEAMEFWKTVSKTRPTRWDGEPNRPLTALSIKPTKVEGH